jgi:hypothetical protein
LITGRLTRLLRLSGYVPIPIPHLKYLTNGSQNIAKAKKEVERLEAEELNGTSAPNTPTTAAPAHANGETKATAAVEEGGSVANEDEVKKSAEADAAAEPKEE